MDSDQGKVFIGGISWETTEEKLKEYFGKYGQVAQVVIMRDKLTGKPRGFGFVAFDNPSDLDAVLQDKHVIDGRTVDAKRAMSREEQQNTTRSGNLNGGRTIGGGGGGLRTKKIFVGGLPQTLTEEGFRQYFQTYGNVTDVVVMYDQATQRPRGFGFVSFDTEDAVDQVLHKTFHDLDGKLVEVKRALPKDANLNSSGARSMGGGSYQSFGGSGANTNPYDSNRYLQPPASGGNYLAYGSSGYGASGYGYGSTTNGASYGGYGVGGYGSGHTGAYGNPTVPSAGYGSAPPGAPRSPWNNQAPASYGANTGYGAPATWNPPTGGGGGSAPTGQSPGGTAAYGSQSYGCGGYGATDGSYGSKSGYGAVGVHAAAPTGGAADQGAGSGGYMGGGYGDANGNPAYSNTWRSDPSQGGGGYGAGQVNGPPGGPAGYGGAYGSASRQTPHK